MRFASERAELVAAGRKLAESGVVKGTSGNLSTRQGEGFLITPTGVPFELVTPEQIVHMAWDGSYEGDVLPSSEWRFHRDLLHTRPEFHSVVHTHSMHATALSIMERPIPAIHYKIAAAGGADIRCSRYATFGEQALADAIVEAMQGRKACLIAHHGVVAAERSLQRAVALAITVEELAQQYMLCLPLGDPPLISAEEIAVVLEKYKTYGQQRSASATH